MIFARVLVPAHVMAGIVAVRDSGRTNMFDLSEVVKVANELGHDDAARWIERNSGLYGRGVFFGFRVMEGDKD